MSKNAASEEVLGTLHNKVASAMIRAIDYVEKGQDTFDEMREPADLVCRG